MALTFDRTTAAVPARVYDSTSSVPISVAYPAPTIKWAKHARKRCQGCGVPLQGKYYALDLWTWTCVRCGDDAIARNEVIR